MVLIKYDIFVFQDEVGLPVVEFPPRFQYDILEEVVVKARPTRIKFYIFKMNGTERARRNLLYIDEIHVDITNEYIDDFLIKLHGIHFETNALIISAYDSVVISSTSFTKLVCISSCNKYSYHIMISSQ